MLPLRYEVVDSEWGIFRFGVDAGGVLFAIELPRGDRRGAAGLLPARSAWARWLHDFLAGKSPAFPGRWAMPGGGPFFERVYRCVAAIPGGAVLSYGEVAARCGSPGATRAVGNAMARNPLPLIVPCHRVVASAGLGGFGGGLALKRGLLEREAAQASAPRKRPALNNR